MFLHFELKTQAIAIGERIKGGTFRPCIETIPTSTLRGSFRDHFGLIDTLAIGFFRGGTYQKDIFTYAPFDAFLGTAKLPISLEYLKPANGTKAIMADIYVVKNGTTESLTKVVTTEISLGSLKSKGFGRCELRYIGEVNPNLKVGYLKGRLLEDECSAFGIIKVIKPCYGYLFYPTSEVSGVYKRALFEGSIVKGPDILIEEEYKYDY
ncbi:MAG: hypothetical protein ACUVUQ_09620 [Thermodesulfovibrionales bacterium]